MADSQTIIEKDPQEIMQEAVNLHQGHNRDDEAWLTQLGIPDTAQSEILVRMIQRGGDWLDFVQGLSGYDGDFRVLTEVS